MNNMPWENPTPDGFSDETLHWLDPDSMTLRLDTASVAVICTRAPTVERFPTRDRALHPVLSALGPDVLAPDFDPQLAASRVPGSPCPTAAEVLLDQRVACGIGNVYKSELLFLERLDPFTPPDRVDARRWAAIYARARDLMRANLGPGPRITTGSGPGLPDHWVYGRPGRPCLRCGTRIRLRTHGATLPRVTFWCPRCQDAQVE